MKRGQAHPPRTKSVKRPSRWGNPEKARDDSRDEHVRTIRVFWKHLEEHPELLERARDPEKGLRGWNLACACEQGQVCHGDVWLELANADGPLRDVKRRWERDVAAGRTPLR